MVISITFILLTSFVEAMGFGDWLKDKDEPSGGEIEREFQTEASSDLPNLNPNLNTRPRITLKLHQSQPKSIRHILRHLKNLHRLQASLAYKN